MKGKEMDYSPSEPIRPLLENEMGNLTLDESDAEEDLETFRQRWRAELEQKKKEEEQVEKAEKLFREGCDHEKAGNMSEAVRSYTKAVKLVPDIEKRIYKRDYGNYASKAQRTHVQGPSTSKNAIENDESEEIDLETVFRDRLAERTALFLSDDAANPLLRLPVELLRLILRYVVGSSLDVRSLEAVASTSVYFYLLARNGDIWHRVCRKTFDLPPKYICEFLSWRDMYLQVPHLQFFGVYVAKTTYLRHGESSFQDKFYRPWHMVTYYRILRFFANGSVLMLTSPEHPSTLVGHLRNRRDAKGCEGILFGRYWNNGSSISMKLTQVVNRKKARQHQVLNSKRLKGVVAPHELVEKNFFLELKFSERRSHSNKAHGILLWSKYEYSHVLVDGSLSKGDFHVIGDTQSYPPFYLSRVKSFALPDGFDEVLC
ncbi:hypothetical protein QR680_017735 [Steinernema hermaphroditum]|uniref:F-box only protein 9 n=1 Tax=Steinernema hermaphroditum TaxID=289476 RepID=A0AA39HFM8_9BILA|nr:hypothetical protein QR680_017735 [Steinernema hermaphroditum]